MRRRDQNATDVRRDLAAYHGNDERLHAAIATLSREPEERQAVILDATARLANAGLRNFGNLLAFEVILAIGIHAAEEGV